jgi:ABC-type multidrug transport system permease subunit
MGNLEQIYELSRARVLLFLREPEVLFWVFLFPLLLAAVLAFAFRRGEIQPNRVAVVAEANVAAAPEVSDLLERLARAPYVEVETIASWEDARSDLLSGKLDAVVEPNGPGLAPTVHLDPERPEAETARLRLLLALGASGGDESFLAVEPFNETGSRYIDFLFPGLIGMNLMSTGMWVIGLAVAEMRQRRVLRRLLVTPMRRPAFLSSFLVARGAFLAAEIAALTLFGAWALDVPFRGSLAAFVVIVLLGGTIFAGVGLLATARARTIQGASGYLNLAMLPMWLLSGVFFSYERFPETVQPAIRLLPLTALNDALRDTMLEGAGLMEIGPELATMGVWGVVTFAIALKIFRWE